MLKLKFQLLCSPPNINSKFNSNTDISTLIKKINSGHNETCPANNKFRILTVYIFRSLKLYHPSKYLYQLDKRALSGNLQSRKTLALFPIKYSIFHYLPNFVFPLFLSLFSINLWPRGYWMTSDIEEYLEL
jgi:hypothetical protein